MRSLCVLGALFLFVGCRHSSGFRVVYKNPSGGVLALDARNDRARDASLKKAQPFMRKHCTSGFDIVEEGENVVGQTVSTSGGASFGGTHGEYSSGGAASYRSEKTTRDDVEYRVRYQCRDVAPPPQGSSADQSKSTQWNSEQRL